MIQRRRTCSPNVFCLFIYLFVHLFISFPLTDPAAVAPAHTLVIAD